MCTIRRRKTVFSDYLGSLLVLVLDISDYSACAGVPLSTLYRRVLYSSSYVLLYRSSLQNQNVSTRGASTNHVQVRTLRSDAQPVGSLRRGPRTMPTRTKYSVHAPLILDETQAPLALTATAPCSTSRCIDFESKAI
jgi:hypothetical protein